MTSLWNGADLQAATGASCNPDLNAAGVSIDTRSLRKGDVFIAIKGDTHDGHDHIAEAFEKGASCCIVQRDITDASGTTLLVDNTVSALHAMGAYARRRFKGRMIAVTGSVGKTTTKNMLSFALSCQGMTHAADKSFNNHLGVPLTLARLPAEAAWCICEIGMNHRGEIAPLAKLVRPDLAIITTIGNSHIGHLGTLEAIAEEKSALFAALSPGGIAISPDAIPFQKQLADTAQARHARYLSVGTGREAEMRMLDLQLRSDGSSFTFCGRHVSLTTPGAHMAENAALVLAAVKSLGADPAKAAEALGRYTPDAGRGSYTPILNGDVHLLDESYNASSLSMEASLSLLALMPGKRRIAVIGDMLEMGAYTQEAHLNLLPALSVKSDLVFCCGSAMRDVFNQLPAVKKGAWRETASGLAPLVLKEVAAGDVILVKGSFGSRMRDVVDALIKQGNKG